MPETAFRIQPAGTEPQLASSPMLRLARQARKNVIRAIDEDGWYLGSPFSV